MLELEPKNKESKIVLLRIEKKLDDVKQVKAIITINKASFKINFGKALQNYFLQKFYCTTKLLIDLYR